MTHDWMISEREYTRQETRRGRRHAFEHLDPASTALVVVDMVPFFTDGNAYCQAAIPKINRIAAALRDAGGLITWVLPSGEDRHSELSREFFGTEVAELFRTSGGQGPLPARLCSDLNHQPNDVFVEKEGFSAFFPGYSPLPDIFSERGVRTVIVTGTVTNVCCESSARDARALGYRVIVVADANAAVTDAAHNGSLYTLYRTFADVRTADEVESLIARPRGD